MTPPTEEHAWLLKLLGSIIALVCSPFAWSLMVRPFLEAMKENILEKLGNWIFEKSNEKRSELEIEKDGMLRAQIDLIHETVKGHWEGAQLLFRNNEELFSTHKAWLRKLSEEMLAALKEIKASEKRMYDMATDIRTAVALMRSERELVLTKLQEHEKKLDEYGKVLKKP